MYLPDRFKNSDLTSSLEIMRKYPLAIVIEQGVQQMTSQVLFLLLLAMKNKSREIIKITFQIMILVGLILLKRNSNHVVKYLKAVLIIGGTSYEEL